MTAVQDPWRTLLQADAARLGERMHTARLDKEARTAVRSLLWRVYALAGSPAGDGPPADDATALQQPPPPLDPAAALGLLRELESWLRAVGDDRGAGAKRLKEVRIQKPLAERVAVPPSSRQTQHLAAAVDGHFRTRLALTPERLAWFEARAAAEAPTAVATVRQPASDPEAERLDLELLRRAGKSKFS